jgi:nucleoside-diphosphate-sugar epimerase
MSCAVKTFLSPAGPGSLGAGFWKVSSGRMNSSNLAHKPVLASHPSIRILQGDMTDFVFPDGEYKFVIHAAAEREFISVDRQQQFDTIVEGTRRVLEFAKTHNTRKLLFTSSGAVYGKQPVDLPNNLENYEGVPGPLDPAFAYGEGKRTAEALCVLAAIQDSFEVKIARCFAFVGPFLPLNQNFAVGNFIRDALRGNPISIKGDGTSIRSYLYAADLAIWLWTILILGKNGQAYNVGSAEAVTIKELADEISRLVTPQVPVIIQADNTISNKNQRYVPMISKAETDLNLKIWIDRVEGIRRTINWQKREMRDESG